MAGIKPEVGDLVRSRIVCATADQIGENVLLYQCATVATGGCTLAEMASAIDTLVFAQYIAAISIFANYRGVGCQNTDPPISTEYTTSANAGPGTVNFPLAPTQTSAILRKQSSQGGPAGRGRLYLPFPAVNAFANDGSMTAGYLALAQAVAAVIPTILVVTGATGTSTFDLVLVTRGSTNPNRLVDTVTAVGLWGTQRRRGQYGRKNVIPF